MKNDGNLKQSKKKIASKSKKIVKGSVNPQKTKIASVMSGMGSGYYPSAYTASSYVGDGTTISAFGDVPLYFALMNENNGGLLYWPVTLKEKYSWYRYWYRSEPYVGAAIDLHLELPLSKIMLKMPQMKDKKKRQFILKKYEKVCDNLKLFEKLKSILLEYLVIGNCYVFLEWDEQNKEWKKMLILPPEEVSVFKYPFSDHSRIEYKPERLIASIKELENKGINLKNLTEDSDLFDDLVEKEDKKLLSHIPQEIIEHMIKNDNKIILDTDPYSGDGEQICGSFVYHMARNKHEYFDLGISILERILVPLLMKEHYRYTQLSLAGRNMTPRNKISAPNISPQELDELREQVDLSMLDPDYTIVTNYEWNWELIGADNRLIDLQREYETIDQQIFAGLGVTREILTGEGMYSGNRITVEIMNTRYMLMREVLKNMIETNIFKPMAVANDFYELDEFGNKVYCYPKLSFNRLTIRDNQEVFDSLFQLYQKGSLPIDIILDLFNIDSDEVHEKLKEDLFTVKDSTFNEMLRDIYSAVAQKIGDNSDLAEQMVEYLKGPLGEHLHLSKEDEEEDYNGEDNWGFEEEEENEKEVNNEKPMQEEVSDNEQNNEILDKLSDEDMDNIADKVVDNVKEKIPNVSQEEIEKALNTLKTIKNKEKKNE